MATEKQPGSHVMSLAAQFDDLCRLTQSGFSYGLIEEDIINFLRTLEVTRAKTAVLKSQAADNEQRIRELESEIKVKDSKLCNLRFALSKEVASREKFERKSHELAAKLSQVRELITPSDEMPNKQKLLSCFEGLPRLEALEEVSFDSSNLSISYEYDKTEDDILGISRRSEGNRRSSAYKRRSSVDPVAASSILASKKTRCDLSMGECNAVTTSDNNTNSDEKQESVTPEVGSPTQNRFKALFKSASEFQFKTPHDLPPSTTTTTTSSSNQVTKHEFLAKYVFRPEPCNVCKKSVGGLLTKNLLKCGNCMISIHANCQNQVTVPCIPVVQRTFNAKRGSRLTTVADFVSSSQSPKVPALIYHCCKEIERRGLVEPGLYRIPGSEKDVTELKNKILRSKNGIPHLNQYDLNTLCGVVKKFLCTLDEPLIQRSLWRDFVEASQLNDTVEQMEQMKNSVKEMNEPNRETLAYLIIHLQKIADAPLCKMPRANLAKVFAPTIVGQLHSHQSTAIPTLEKMAVLAKQIAVMEMLLDSPVDFWKNILDHDSPFSTGTESSDSSNSERRTSRAFSGGIVDSRGTITPCKTQAHGNYIRAKQKVGAVRPLF